MKLELKISQDLKAAMINKDVVRLEVCRSIKSAILIAKTAKGNCELDHDQEIAILQKILKQCKDSAKIYREKSRMDLANHENKQAELISEYLPKQFTEIEVEALVTDTINKLNLNSKKDMGLLIKEVVKQAKGRSDGKMIAQIVKKKLLG
tara:strand:- start:4873 stop:5322 length:450 start_codon:yes stop_codon:yes gene_type:complete